MEGAETDFQIINTSQLHTKSPQKDTYGMLLDIIYTILFKCYLVKGASPRESLQCSN